MITCVFITAPLWPTAVDRTTDPPSPTEDRALSALTAIAGEGMMASHAYDDLEEAAGE